MYNIPFIFCGQQQGSICTTSPLYFVVNNRGHLYNIPFIFCGQQQGSICTTSPLYFVVNNRGQFVQHPLYILWSTTGVNLYNIPFIFCDFKFCGQQQGSICTTSPLYFVVNNRGRFVQHPLYILWSTTGVNLYNIFIFCGQQQGSNLYILWSTTGVNLYNIPFIFCGPFVQHILSTTGVDLYNNIL